MRSKRLIAAAFALAGCYASADYVAYDSPPPPREEIVIARPGFVFVRGHWRNVDGRWRWHEGTYVRARPGYTYEEGGWVRRGDRHIWLEGHWRAAG
jgi:hypothetical protein